MFDFSNLSRTLVSAVGALFISTLCVTAAVGPAKAAPSARAIHAITDAATPAR